MREYGKYSQKLLLRGETRMKTVRLSEFREGMVSYVKFGRSESDNASHKRAACKAIDGIIKQELTDKHRETVILYYYENKNMAEIASILGINKSTVSRRLSASRKKIRSLLNYGFYQVWQNEDKTLAG